MAKKQVPEEGSRKQKNSNTQKKSDIKRKGSSTISTKNKNKIEKKVSKTVVDDSSSEENKALVAPSSSTESRNDDVVDPSVADEDRVYGTDEDRKAEKKKPKSNEQNKKSKGIKRRFEEDGLKNKGEKKSKKEDDDDNESDVEQKNENALSKFPTNRISRIIKSQNPDVKISQEAVFLINRATEKFLEVFCKEAYACLFLENKTYAAYKHLSSVVAKRKQFGFLSDFVPEKVKAADALTQISEAEK